MARGITPKADFAISSTGKRADTIVVLLRPKASHRNLNGVVRYAPRPQRGKMRFKYEVVRI
jgi:hypothetical protein